MATTPKKLFLPPRHIPGEGMAEVVRNSILHAVSQRITDPTGSAGLVVGANQIFTVPDDTFIYDIRVNVKSAFNQSVTLTIGDGGDADRFMDDTQFAPSATGWKSMLQDAQPGSFGYVYADGDTIDVTRAGGTPTAGSADVHVFYIPRASEAGIS
jgi:hypothetical protein